VTGLGAEATTMTNRGHGPKSTLHQHCQHNTTRPRRDSTCSLLIVRPTPRSDIHNYPALALPSTEQSYHAGLVGTRPLAHTTPLISSPHTMEKIKVGKVAPLHAPMQGDETERLKVENVQAFARGSSFDGTLHITTHHLVFRYLPPCPQGVDPTANPPREKTIWITYPQISYCCLRPCPSASHYKPSIRLRCRDFKMFAFNFLDEKDARNVYDSIRALSCKIGRLDRLLAFAYSPKPPESDVNGWQIYDARKEFKRLGISPKDSEKGWRISEINTDYRVGLVKFRKCCKF
jgi:hypothetical protein